MLETMDDVDNKMLWREASMGRYRDGLFIPRKSEPIPSPLPSPHVLDLPQRVNLYRLPMNYLGNPANVTQAQTSSLGWLSCPTEMFST